MTKIQKARLRKILVPVNGFNNAAKALAKAIHIAYTHRHNDVSITLLYISTMDRETLYFYKLRNNRCISAAETAPYEKICRLMSEIPSDIKAELAVEIGRPAVFIVNKAKREGYDVIVMAASRTALISTFPGSTSQYVRRHASCHVVLVPDE